MNKAIDVTDRQSFLRWVKARPERYGTAASLRCALRAFPYCCAEHWGKDDRQVLEMARALIVTYASLFEPDDDDSLFFAKHGASRASRGTKGNLTLQSQRATSARVAAHLALQTAINGDESPSSHFADAAFEATCPEWTKKIAESGTGSDGLAGHFWRRLAADCRAFDQSDQLLFGDLFPSVSHRPGADHEVGIWHQTKDRGMAHDSNWQFWVNWYDGFVSGKPLSLMRQSQVATIDDVTWKAGPAAVAEEIRRIEEQHRLLNEVRELRAEWAEFRARSAPASEALRGHNQPPELLEAEGYAQIHAAADSAERAIADIESELENPAPDPERLIRQSNLLLAALSTVAKWIGAKADLAVDTLIKWGIPASGLWLVTNHDKVQPVAVAIQAFAKALLPGP